MLIFRIYKIRNFLENWLGFNSHVNSLTVANNAKVTLTAEDNPESRLSY